MRQLIRWWALVAALGLITAACGGGDQAADGGDQTGGGEAVVVGGIFDLSGATADVGTPYAEGIRDYVEWRNANGGVAGRQIDLRSQDYQYKVSIAEQLYSQYRSEGAVAFLGWGTGDTEALRSRVTSDEIPFMSASYAETLTDPALTPYNFVVALSYSDQMRVALQYLAANADGHVEVAVFHHDSPFGLSPVEDGRSYIEHRNLDIGYQAYAMPTGATDYVGELSRAQQQGADYIVVQNTSSPAAQLAKNVQALGMDAQIVCLNWCGDELFVQLAGDAAEGVLGVLPFAPPTAAEGDTSTLESWLATKGQRLEDVNLHYTQGWYTMEVMAEGIANVVESGEAVTGPAVAAALRSMEPIDTPVTTEIDFCTDSQQGMESARVYRVFDGQWWPVSDVLTP